VKVTAAICTRGRPTMIAACVRSVLACDYAQREVLVVDQSDDGGTRAVIEELQRGHPELTYLATTTRGLSAARNAAVRSARAEVIAFTDDDCLADRGWLGAVVDELHAAPAVSAVCGRALPVVEARLIAGPVSVRTDEERRVFTWPASPWSIGSGANMAFRTSVLRAVGPFDERLGAGAWFQGAEDSDMLYRILKSGRQIVYSPRPMVRHRQWRNQAQQRALAYGYGLGIGAFGVKHLRRGDGRALRSLAGWSVATLVNLAGALGGGDRSRAEMELRLLAGIAVGAVEMMLGRGRPSTPWRHAQ
jgi:O-antigen biosynthesis protein